MVVTYSTASFTPYPPPLVPPHSFPSLMTNTEFSIWWVLYRHTYYVLLCTRARLSGPTSEPLRFLVLIQKIDLLTIHFKKVKHIINI